MVSEGAKRRMYPTDGPRRLELAGGLVHTPIPREVATLRGVLLVQGLEQDHGVARVRDAGDAFLEARVEHHGHGFVEFARVESRARWGRGDDQVQLAAPQERQNI